MKKYLGNYKLLMIMFLFLIGAASIFWGERIPVGDGFGWDGKFFGSLVKDFYVRGMNPYQMQRIIPSAMVNLVLNLFQVPLENEYIVRAFQVYNLAAILLGCCLWLLIANELALSLKARWIGFIGLFINFAVLKQAFYYSVLTDISALVLGLLMLLFYLRGQVLGLFVVALIGAFTWPIIIYGGVILLLFPRNSTAPALRNNSRLGVILSLLLTVLLAAFIARAYYFDSYSSETAPIVRSVVWFSIAACLLYVFLSTKILLGSLSLSNLRDEILNIKLKNFVLAILALLIVKTVLYLLADYNQPTFTVDSYLMLIAITSITKPFIFLVAHAIYFGPVVLLLIILWKPFCRVIQKNGLGLILFMLSSVLISVSAESRQSMSALPFFVAFLAKAADQFDWQVSSLWLLGLIALLFSKVWLPINVAPMEGSILDFPLQYYFMNHGPWMSNFTYLIQGLIVILTGAVIYDLTRRAASTR